MVMKIIVFEKVAEIGPKSNSNPRSYYMANCLERIVMAIAGTPRQREFCEKIINAMLQDGEQAQHESLIHCLYAAEYYADGLRKRKREELEVA